MDQKEQCGTCYGLKEWCETFDGLKQMKREELYGLKVKQKCEMFMA